MKRDGPSLSELLKKEPWIPALLVLGLALLLWPGFEGKKTGDEIATEAEQRLCRTLEKMEGVGEVRVLLAQGEGRSGGYTGAVVVCRGAGSGAVRLRLTRAVAAFTGLGTDKILVEQWKSS